MRLTRCEDQGDETLEEFYINLSNEEDQAWQGRGRAMLGLLARLHALPDARSVWGLTSLYQLCLLAEDTYESPRYVTIAALDSRNYFVEYLMPAHLAPWPSSASVRGEARSEDEAVRMILIAMDKSEGWSHPREQAP